MRQPEDIAMPNRRQFLTTGIGSLVAAHALPTDRMRFAMSGHGEDGAVRGKNNPARRLIAHGSRFTWIRK